MFENVLGFESRVEQKIEHDFQFGQRYLSHTWVLSFAFDKFPGVCVETFTQILLLGVNVKLA
jgi:hypothetical protein